jgi:putative NADPH-quinone reductase
LCYACQYAEGRRFESFSRKNGVTQVVRVSAPKYRFESCFIYAMNSSMVEHYTDNVADEVQRFSNADRQIKPGDWPVVSKDES